MLYARSNRATDRTLYPRWQAPTPRPRRFYENYAHFTETANCIFPRALLMPLSTRLTVCPGMSCP